MFLRISLSIIFIWFLGQFIIQTGNENSYNNENSRIRAVGSSTVFPFATIVAEYFGKKAHYPTPIIESTGTGGGIQSFCAGNGNNTADIANASRKIKDSELELCKKNGVKNILEFPIGHDGLVIAGYNGDGGIDLNITKRQLFMALAPYVPINGKLVKNPYQKWSDISPELPNRKIKVLGPPPTSGTRDSFAEMVLEGGCTGWLEAEKLGLIKEACRAVREDGHWQDMGENDNLIVQKIVADPDNVGIFGFAYYGENQNLLSAALIDNIKPTKKSIIDKSYSISRPLFLYVKKDHIAKKEGIIYYLREFISDDASGEYGYLPDRGLIPIEEHELKELRSLILQHNAGI